jgi:hypothetical protein
MSATRQKADIGERANEAAEVPGRDMNVLSVIVGGSGRFHA